MMRWFDNTTLNFCFRGETFNLQPIATAILNIFHEAERLIPVLWDRASKEGRGEQEGKQE
jgi:hypothetical protein